MPNPHSATAAAIIVGFALVAAAIFLVGRWEITSQGEVVFRVDRWTGEVTACMSPAGMISMASQWGVGVHLRCRILTQKELKQNHPDPDE